MLTISAFLSCRCDWYQVSFTSSFRPNRASRRMFDDSPSHFTAAEQGPSTEPVRFLAQNGPYIVKEWPPSWWGPNCPGPDGNRSCHEAQDGNCSGFE